MTTDPRVPPASLDDALQVRNVELTRATRTRLAKWCQLMWDANRQVNLTRHTDWQTFVDRDLTDVMQLSALLDPDLEVLDIGSGGGVPGLVLAILRPDLTISVCESVGKKAKLLQEFCDALELPVTVCHDRAENVLDDFGFDCCTARAVGPLWKLFHWLDGRWASVRRLYAFKGPRWRDELGVAKEKKLTRRLLVKPVARYPLRSTDPEAEALESVILRIQYDPH